MVKQIEKVKEVEEFVAEISPADQASLPDCPRQNCSWVGSDLRCGVYPKEPPLKLRMW